MKSVDRVDSVDRVNNVNKESGQALGRRQRYTRQAIKDAMLELLADHPYDKISVASLCRQADVGRATFYTHYDSLSDVIKELAYDAILNAPGGDEKDFENLVLLLGKLDEIQNPEQLAQHMALLPVCQRVVDNPRYRVLFRDPAVTDYILMQIYAYKKASAVEDMMQRFSLEPRQAELFFLYLLSGAFSVNKALSWQKSDDWYEFQKLLLTFLKGGYEALDHR